MQDWELVQAIAGQRAKAQVNSYSILHILDPWRAWFDWMSRETQDTHLPGRGPDHVIQAQKTLSKSKADVPLPEGLRLRQHLANVRGAVLCDLRPPLDLRTGRTRVGRSAGCLVHRLRRLPAECYTTHMTPDRAACDQLSAHARLGRGLRGVPALAGVQES